MKRSITFLVLALGAAAHANLLHHYDFSSGVVDLAGSENGSLFDGASVSGGVLNLDGSNDYVEFGTHLVPTSGSYTVALFAKETVTKFGHVEFISQGFSGGPGYYIGHDPSYGIRATDSWTGTGVTMPTDGLTHHYALVVDAAASTSKLYIDGILKNTLASAIATTPGGTNTRLGNQFSSYSEYLGGTIDDVRIYDNALTDNDISRIAAVPEPATMLALGLGVVALRRRRR